ncbi:MAG: hypothetical protein HS103_17265 [Anaerolineales bacterium]|nr:hypothetical protein [Anaerolineales bacterium]
MNNLHEVAQAFPKQAPEPPERPVGTTNERLGDASSNGLAAEGDHPCVGNGQQNQPVGEMLLPAGRESSPPVLRQKRLLGRALY